MCIGCRERLAQDELIRLQPTAEGVVVIERAEQRVHGRSIYLCPDKDCFDRMLRRSEGIIFKRSKYDKIIVRLEPRQVERLRYVFKHAARRFRGH